MLWTSTARGGCSTPSPHYYRGTDSSGLIFQIQKIVGCGCPTSTLELEPRACVDVTHNSVVQFKKAIAAHSVEAIVRVSS